MSVSWRVAGQRDRYKFIEYWCFVSSSIQKSSRAITKTNIVENAWKKINFWSLFTIITNRCHILVIWIFYDNVYSNPALCTCLLIFSFLFILTGIISIHQCIFLFFFFFFFSFSFFYENPPSISTSSNSASVILLRSFYFISFGIPHYSSFFCTFSCEISHLFNLIWIWSHFVPPYIHILKRQQLVSYGRRSAVDLINCQASSTLLSTILFFTVKILAVFWLFKSTPFRATYANWSGFDKELLCNW